MTTTNAGFLSALFLLSWNAMDSLVSLSNSWVLSKSSSPFFLASIQNLLALLMTLVLSHVSLQASPLGAPTATGSGTPSKFRKTYLIGAFSGLFSGLCVLASMQAGSDATGFLGSLGALDPLVVLLLSFAMKALPPSMSLTSSVSAVSLGLLLPVLFDIKASFSGVFFTLMALLAKGTQHILLQTLLAEGDSPLHSLRVLCSVFQSSGIVHLMLFLLFELGSFDGLPKLTGIAGPLLLNAITYFSSMCVVTLVLKNSSVLVMSLTQALRQVCFVIGYSGFSAAALSPFHMLGLITSAIGILVSLTRKIKGLRVLHNSSSLLLILFSSVLCFSFLSSTQNSQIQALPLSSYGVTTLAIHYFSPLNSPLLWNRKLQASQPVLAPKLNTGPKDPDAVKAGLPLHTPEKPVPAVPTLSPTDPLVAQFQGNLKTFDLPSRPTLPPSSTERVQISPLFVGTLRSGLNQVHKALKKADLDFRLDVFGKDGSVSWRQAMYTQEELERQNLIPFPIFHLLRHPLSVVSEIQETCLCDSITKTDEENAQLRELMANATGNPLQGSLMEQGLRHWVDWNLLIRKHYPTSMLTHSESLSFRVLRDNLRTSDNYSLFPWSRAILYLPPRNVLDFTWEHLQGSVPGLLVQQAKDLATEYHYASKPPKTVLIYSYNCDDQVHYLRDFLSREPYTAERPLRFVYKHVRAKSDMLWQPSDMVPYSIFITEPSNWKKLQPVFASMNRTNLVMAHKDEFCQYTPPGLQASLYYRGYWDSNMVDEKKLLWFPLGVRKVFPRVFPHEIQPVSKRIYVFNLIVSLSTSPSRLQLVDVVNGMQIPHFVHTVKTWDANFKGYLEPQEYKQKLLESVFTLSPRGHNVECYRIYEACEAGSIPIIEDWEPTPGEKSCKNSLEPFKRSGAPFVYIRDWTTLPDIINELIKDPETIAQRQLDLLKWYRTFTTKTITDFENTLSSLWD